MRDNNPDRLDDGARAEAEMKEREAAASAAESLLAEAREALEAAVRAANLALFVIRKQGVMPNSSWEGGFNGDMAKAEGMLAKLTADPLPASAEPVACFECGGELHAPFCPTCRPPVSGAVEAELRERTLDAIAAREKALGILRAIANTALGGTNDRRMRDMARDALSSAPDRGEG